MRRAERLRTMTYIGAILACLFSLKAAPALANGCSGTQTTPTPTIPERAAESEIVLDGTVVVLDNHSPGDAIATIQVHQYLKGQGPETVQIRGFHAIYDTISCRNWVDVGGRYIFFASVRSINDTAVWYSVQTKRQAGTIYSFPENIAAVLEVSGQDAPITPVPATAETEDAAVLITPVPSIPPLEEAVMPVTDVPAIPEQASAENGVPYWWVGILVIASLSVGLVVGWSLRSSVRR